MSGISNLLKNSIVEIAIGAGALALVSIYTLKQFSKTPKIIRIIDTMEVFKKNTVHMRDPDHVEEMVSLLIKGGAAKLQVISDFDHTITRVHLNGVECCTTYGVLEQSPYVTEDSRNKSQFLYEYYHLLEIDPYLTMEEKAPYMNEWYSKSNSLMLGYGIRRDNITGMVKAASPVLRDGCDTFFHILNSHAIPLLIFSAGIGDILMEILKQQDLLYPNMKVIANFMAFNEEEKLLGFKNNLIHTFNKNESSVGNSDYFEHLRTRSNIILLGDSLGDIDMSGGVKDANCILKIGFLNKKIDENLPKYLKTYDIVLTDDQTMELANGLLQSIL